jgi:hypothetical protein
MAAVYAESAESDPYTVRLALADILIIINGGGGGRGRGNLTGWKVTGCKEHPYLARCQCKY